MNVGSLSWSLSIEDVTDAMTEAGVRRAAIFTDSQGQVRATHPLFDGIATRIASDPRDYQGHEALFVQTGEESGHLMLAAIHNTRRGQAAGGVRFWQYTDLEAFLRDGLRLSQGMGRKCALASLWWGGGKGVIARKAGTDHRDPEVRKAVYRDFGRFMTGLKGCYITAEDVGTTPPDMKQIFSETRFTTCTPPSLGGSGNPSILTARGVVEAMEAACRFRFESGLKGRTIAMQGAGNVSRYMIEELLKRNIGRVLAVDVDVHSIEQTATLCQDDRLELRKIEPKDFEIFSEQADIFAPNAIGAVLTPRTIDQLTAPIVCGAANNPLEDPERDAALLHERGILFVPDFLANRMGIVNCANEQYGYVDNDPAIESHLDHHTEHGIYQRCLTIFANAKARDESPMVEAQRLADTLMQETHPVWGHRGQQIIDSLLGEPWARRAETR